jgi:ribosomal RNA-processing protein 36
MPARSLPNVRPRLPDAEDDVELESSDGQGDDVEDASGTEEADDTDLSEIEDSGDDGSEDGGHVANVIGNVSFGALKEAQDAISKKRKRGSETTQEQDVKLEALRERLRQIKKQKAKPAHTASPRLPPSQDASHSDGAPGHEDGESDSDSAPSEEGAHKSRTSKHAPAAQSSKYQVTRKRQVVEVPKRVVRDPRFDPLHQASAHPGNIAKAYGFIKEYQQSEIDELKAAVKKTKDEDEKQILRRKITSMENKLKADAAKEREQEVLRRHRKEERERVQQGKTPFYLKQKDIKERALVEKFKSMKGKEREKLIERRQKKEGQKEKRRMPRARRMETG